MEIQITIDDSKAYTKPWTVTEEVRLVLSTDLLEFICDDCAGVVVVPDRRILSVELEPPPRPRLWRRHPSWPGGAITPCISISLPA